MPSTGSDIPVPKVQDVPPIQGIRGRWQVMPRWAQTALPAMTAEGAKNWITETLRQFPNKSYQGIMEEMIYAKSDPAFARSDIIHQNINIIVAQLRGFMQRSQQPAGGKRRTLKKRKRTAKKRSH